MKMVKRIAIQNIKYYKSKNFLIGIAVFLTTLLLFLVPTIGKDMIESQFAATNEIYPSYHALLRDVDGDMVEKLSVYHGIETWGLRSDAALVSANNAQIILLYMDEKGFELNNQKLSEGTLPVKENEIVVSRGVLSALGQEAKTGDTITIPYQVNHDGALDYVKEKPFVITGFLESPTENNTQNNSNALYPALISKEFLEHEVSPEEIRYRFFLRVDTKEHTTTDEIKKQIHAIGESLHISENDIRINDDYLLANYVDPVFVPVIAIIMCIIVFAGVITIYSIYYVGISDRVREYGKLKAMGASKKQLKNMVLLEGMFVAGIFIPAGLIVGTLLTKGIFTLFFKLVGNKNIMMETITQLVQSGKVSLYHLPIYVLAVLVAFLTVRLGLQKPIRVVSKITDMEAIRYQGEDEKKKKGKAWRKSYKEVSVFRLAKIYLAGKKKNVFITVAAMSATGIFVMVVATVLSCANPKESAASSILGQYKITLHVESDNKEHPERKWNNIIKNNPLTEDLKQEILNIDGITDISCFLEGYATVDIYQDVDTYCISGVPDEHMEQLLDGIIEGNVSYEDLQRGDVCIMDKNMLYWYPDIHLGDTLKFCFLDEGNHSVDVKVAAIGDYDSGFNNYNYFLMGTRGLENICPGELNGRFTVFAEEDYNPNVEAAIKQIIGKSDLLLLETWKEQYDIWKSALLITNAAAYAFLGILGMICVMNMVNTMIHSVHLRRREMGMMQALGMTQRQLVKMLVMEGLFYTAGTLILSVGGGSLLGYPVYLKVRELGGFNIRTYHYPFAAAVAVSLILLAIQLLLAVGLGRFVKKDSLIERIRYSE